MVPEDLLSIFSQLKPQLTLMLTILLEDIFQRILSDLGFTESSVTITPEDFPESFLRHLFNSHVSGNPESLSGIASPVAEDIVETVLEKLQVITNHIYQDTVKLKSFSRVTTNKFVKLSEKADVSSLALWTAKIPLSTPNGIAKRMVEIIMDKLTLFATFSQHKRSQHELSAAKGDPQLQQQPVERPPSASESSAPPSSCGHDHSADKSLFPEKNENKLPLSDFQLSAYVQEVARKILQCLKQRLDEEVERSTAFSILFSESIAASQIVSQVLPIFNIHEVQPELQASFQPKEQVLEKLLKKNPEYQKDLQTRSHNAVENSVTETYQIIKERGNSPASLEGRKELQRADVLQLTEDIFTTVLAHLGFLLAAGMTCRMFISAQLQCLLCDLLAQKILHNLSSGTMPGLLSQLVNFERGKHTVPGQKQRNQLTIQQLLGLQDTFPEATTQHLTDQIFGKLVSFLQLLPDCELTPSGQGDYRSQTEAQLRLCAEKLTYAALKLVQEDLEGALQPSEVLPYVEIICAIDILKELLETLNVQINLTTNEIQKRPSEGSSCSLLEAEGLMCVLETFPDGSKSSDLSMNLPALDDSAMDADDSTREAPGALTEEDALANTISVDQTSQASNPPQSGMQDFHPDDIFHPPSPPNIASGSAEDLPSNEGGVNAEPKEAVRRASCMCFLSRTWCRVRKFFRSTSCFPRTSRKTRQVSPPPEEQNV